METLAILLFLSLWISLTEQTPSYLITAPKIIRVSVKESVTVQVFEAERSLDGSIHFLNHNNMKTCSEKYSLQLNHANNFTQVLFVQVSPEYMERCKSRGRMSNVRLVADIPALFTSEKKVNLQLRPKPYFNFIETDKPIYRPRETVRFRTVTLDHAMKVTGCKTPLRLMKEGKRVMEVMSEVHGSDNVCRGEIHLTPTMVGDFEIQAYSTQLYSEFNGHRKFRVEEPAGEKEEEVLSQVVHLTKTRRFFIPGAPFRIQAMVTHPDGTPVPKAPIKVSILISEKISIEKSKQGFTDELGEMSISFVVPEDAREMYVTASINDTRGNDVKSEIAIKAHQSNQVYMHIDVPNVLLYAGDNINVTLTDLGPTNSSSVEHYYYMILSKGKLLHHERIGRSTHTEVQVNITQDMVPYFRMVAYYVTDVHGQNHLVSDSVRVEVEESCDLQMQILPSLIMEDDRGYLLLNIFTHRSADVHVQAVDNKLAKAHVDLGIYEQAFYRKDLYDFGVSYGGGRNAAAVFEDAGLRYLSDLLPPSELSEVSSVPWHRSQLQTQRYDLETQHPFPTVQPLYRTSWMWEIQNTTGTKSFRLTSTISPPQVWEISAFSVSENKELCIFRPLLMKINED